MATVTSVGFTRGRNFQANLRRIFSRENANRPSQTTIAADADVTAVRLNQFLKSETVPNPNIETIEALSIALEVPFDILLQANPTDHDLRIQKKSSRKAS